jgi:putative Holliday junction resolvase
MRYVALDLGDKRTGVAVGDSITGVVVPASALEIPIDRGQGAALLDAIAQAVLEHLGSVAPSGVAGWGMPRDPGEIVIGLPINMDGREGTRARLVRTWADRIAARCARAVRLQDERLTSAQAESSLARSGLTHAQKKQRRDSLAACVILTDYLAGLGKNPPT